MQRVSVLLALVVVVMVAIGRTATAQTQTTYLEVFQQIFQPYCVSCHSSTLPVGQRKGAPVGVDYNTYTNAIASNNEVRANERIQAGTMPPPPEGPLGDDLKDLMQEWADGGFKNENVTPTADAGDDQTVNEGALVTLDGSNSSDPDGTIATYAWTQTAGPTVTLSNATAPKPTFRVLRENTLPAPYRQRTHRDGWPRYFILSRVPYRSQCGQCQRCLAV